VKRPDDEWSEVGLWVRKSYQGNGCGSHMLRLLVEHAFDNHPSVGVYVIHDFSNISMGKTAESLGFETDWIRERELESEADIRNKQSGKVSGIDVRQSLYRTDMGSLSI
jgi:RimJ/RimL family protein N-acetyltransferase